MILSEQWKGFPPIWLTLGHISSWTLYSIGIEEYKMSYPREEEKGKRPVPKKGK